MRSSVSVFMWDQVIVRLSILIDTMSGSNFISPQDIKKIGMEDEVQSLPEYRRFSVQVADGRSIRITSFIRLTWQFAGQRTKYHADFHVFDGLFGYVIIGHQTIGRYRLTTVVEALAGTGITRQTTSRTIPLYKLAIKPQESPRKLSNS